MIEAWFALDQSRVVPCIMPDPQLHDLARLAGIPIEDLFSIDIPSGASREARVKCIVAESQLDYIYNNQNGPYGPNSVHFRWRTNPSIEPQELWLFPLPPRPLFVRPDMASVYIVEAVDCRYYWKRTPFDREGYLSAMSDSTGRIWYTGASGNKDTSNYPNIQFPMGSIQIDPNDSPLFLYDRLANLPLTPECSAAMLADLVASISGVVVQWAGAGTYIYKTIGNDALALNQFMLTYRNAVAGGIATTSGMSVTGGGGSVDSLYARWQAGPTTQPDGGSPSRQIHRMPSQVDVLFPLHANEAKTYYSNDYEMTAFWGPAPAGEQPFQFLRETGPFLSISTARDRYANGVRLQIKEPLTVPAANTVDIPLPAWPNSILSSPSTPVEQGVHALTFYSDLSNDAKNNLTKRCEVLFGRVAWGGWPVMPLGAYRATMLRYTVGVMQGEYVPVTITEAMEDDWVLGPDGLLPTDPRDLVFGTGTIHARRIHNGALQIDSAPPMCRVFPAQITSFTQVPGEWRWAYGFTEVEPRSSTEPTAPSLGIRGRSSDINGPGRKATNLCEQYNSPSPPGGVARIAPGVVQSDFDATIIPKPIDIGVVVSMTEYFPQSNAESNTRDTRKRRYWFSMPNAVRVICTPFTADTDYGSFAAPSALYDDYGTFEAPTNTFDFGTF